MVLTPVDGWYVWTPGGLGETIQRFAENFDARGADHLRSVAARIDAAGTDANYALVGVNAPPELGGGIIATMGAHVWYASTLGPMTAFRYAANLRAVTDQPPHRIVNQAIEQTTAGQFPCVLACQSCAGTDADDPEIYLRDLYAVFPAWSRDHIEIEYLCPTLVVADEFHQVAAILTATVELGADDA
jgi:hypothetical protein